jgi:hypothetical protein
MFPNLRVMFVALLASVLGIGCGLGAMAALRINHQPFTHAADSNPPLQLAYGTGTLAVVSDGTPSPFGVRFEINAPLSPREAIAVPASPASDTPAAAAPSADDQGKAEAKPAAEQEAKADATTGGVRENEQDSVDAIVAGLISDATVPPIAPPQTFAPVQTAVPTETKAAQIAVPAESPPPQVAVSEEAAPVQVVSPGAPALTVKLPAAEQPITIAAITPDNKEMTPTFLGTPVSMPATKTATPKEAQAHKARRVKRARAASAAADASNFAAPTFQPLSGSAAETPLIGQAPQPEPRRVVKRRHAAKKPAQVTSAKPDNGSLATVATTKR